MSGIRKITRVAIFIDYDNFVINYCKKFKVEEGDISIWNELCDQFAKCYETRFIKNDFEVVDHIGTYLCVGLSEFRCQEATDMKKRFRSLDRKNGFIVKYGTRSGSYKDKNGNLRLGKEKGVDTEIVCQMLMGAFLDHYDACILMSDDADYIPAVSRVQDYFGKKVIQAGFQNGVLREHAYGNIPLEEATSNLLVGNGN
jgi:uncharacterized LabA/DUF88 family protein